MKLIIAIYAAAAALLLPANIQAQVDDTKRYDMAQRENNRSFSPLPGRRQSGLLPASSFAGVPQDISGKGVKVWSLQECIDYANEHNLDVKMRQAGIDRQEVVLNTARNRRLPDLSANASHSFSFGRSASGYDNTYQDRNSRSTQWSAATSVPVFTGFQINNEIAVAKLDLQAVAAELEKAKEDMEITVTTSYLQILYYREMLEIAGKQAGLSREQLERIKKMYDNGRASEAQIYEVEAQLANDELSVVQAASDLQMAILNLTQLLELPTPEGFDVEEPADDVSFILVRKPDIIFETALTTRASVRAEEFRLKSREKNIDLARGAYYPTLSFGAGYGNNYYAINGFDNTSFSEQLKNNRNEYFGLTLRIPLFDRFVTRNNVRSAKLNMYLQELQLENTKKSLYKEIQQAYYNAVTSGEKYKSSEAAYKSAEKAFGYMQEKLNNGRATMYEYNDSKTGMTRALSNRTQAKYDFILRKRILEFYERQ
ncbi:MAG: TolC family protein [Tannerella sp.]|jgi:outer membrane protein|nr:TolC family protein [Tannerella sp.]